jgi:hypothetical protein
MALGSMAEEIFRFSVVRNPEALDSAKLEDTVVRIAPDKPDRDHTYLTELSALRARNPTRRAFLDQAAQLMQESAFASDLEALKTPLWQYVERVQRLPKLTLSAARDLIKAVFGKNAGALAQDDAFRADSIAIVDSLVLASVVPTLFPGLRTRLMQARRAIAFIERLASERTRDMEGSARLPSATLRLGDRLCIAEVVLLALQVRTNVLCRHQSGNRSAQNLRCAALIRQKTKL